MLLLLNLFLFLCECDCTNVLDVSVFVRAVSDVVHVDLRVDSLPSLVARLFNRMIARVVLVSCFETLS